MPQSYHVVSRNDSTKALQSRTLAQALTKDGQLILPLLELLNTAETAIDDIIDVMGRATIEAVLLMSAAEVAGPRQQGKKTDREVVDHGSQQGRVKLKDRQVQVQKPRLQRRKSAEGQPGEVEIPAYATSPTRALRASPRYLVNAFEVQPRDQLINAGAAPQVRRQDRGREHDVIVGVERFVLDTKLADSDFVGTSEDRPIRQLTVTDDKAIAARKSSMAAWSICWAPLRIIRSS